MRGIRQNYSKWRFAYPMHLKQKEALNPEEKELLLTLFSSTLDKVNVHRNDEGKALAVDFEKRLSNLEQLLKEAIAVDPERKIKVTEKLNNALEQLSIDVDQNRLEQELIYYQKI